MSGQHATVITPTYAADFEHARTLCASLDRFLRIPHRHLLIVPSNDVALFRPLAGPRRKVISKESVLGRHGFHRLPVPRRIRVPGLIDRRIKEQWWLRGAGRLSGWLVQQIVKLSAPELTEDEHLVFIDSDVALVRPFEWRHLDRDGVVRLHEHHRGTHHDTHHRWRDSALALTGGAPEQGPPTNYIGHLIGWRRSNLVALQQRIEAVTGMDWRLAVARRKEVSEYILYGYFVRAQAGDAGHVREDLGLVRSLWADDAASLESFAEAPDEGHVAVHIQSTLPMPDIERERWVARLSGGAVA
jgi:hypothetical protein